MTQGKTAITSGGAGDIIFSIPIMQSLGIKTLYIKESFYPEGYGSMYSGLKGLIEMQGFTVLPTRDDGLGDDMFEPGVKYDYNMDAWRKCRMRGRWHIIFSMMSHWGVMRRNWKTPWLKLDNKPSFLSDTGDYTLWFLSPRWRQSTVDWKSVYQSVPGVKYFVGFHSDWEGFNKLVGEDYGTYMKTDTFLDLARLIRDSRALYCNQGPALAIAQGLGHKYFCAFKTGKTNCMMMTTNENHLK